ncbi:Protein of unknown function [Tistlia consotensis]|uniref:DUF3037 domain-containing protein n=1 Tax=Tistlia consotensis USBA 355 TaxID=560819 RepID=A0A1Y6C196_9PROT|nr:DUF3037 domain-containing protein [Tistlia consotensis]SMF38970.1 Protein of unknown function [Tistlia consotensis USBA 355]SNR36647.1 Protein of unknown function [Tistlia consotensis]
MTTKNAYSYTVLRYVHDVVSGEAMNVGVVMHVAAEGFLKIHTRKTIGRLKQVFPDLDREAFVMTMRAVDRGISAAAKNMRKEPLFDSKSDALSHALNVLPRDDSALQWSFVGKGLTNDPQKTFDQLYERFVSHYDQKLDRRRTDEDVWRPVKEKLSERGVVVPFGPKKVIGRQDQIEFKKAWKNGCWHAYEPVSLDLADAEGIKDKARRWRGHLSAVADGVKEDIELHFILGRPQNRSLMKAYESAKEILRGADFASEVVDEDQLDRLVSSIEDEYRSHTQASD